MMMIDNCPICSKRIKDTDDNGCEDGMGQRWCRHHLLWLCCLMSFGTIYVTPSMLGWLN